MGRCGYNTPPKDRTLCLVLQRKIPGTQSPGLSPETKAQLQSFNTLTEELLKAGYTCSSATLQTHQYFEQQVSLQASTSM